MNNPFHLPDWAKLLITVAVLALCFFAFGSLGSYIEQVPQPAPDGTFAVPAASGAQ